MALGSKKTLNTTIARIGSRGVGTAAPITKANLAGMERLGEATPSLGIHAELRTDSKVNDQEFAMVSPLIKPALASALKVMGEAIKMSIRQEFVRAQTIYFNTDTTIEIKGGKPPMNDTGRLNRAIMSPGGVKMDMGTNTVVCRVSWDMPEAGSHGIRGFLRKKQDYEYIRALENGANMKVRASKMWASASGKPKFTANSGGGYAHVRYEMALKRIDWYMYPRAFFVQGLKNGMKIGSRAGAQIMKPVLAPLQEQAAAIGRMPSFAPDVGMPSTMMGFGMFFAPPTSMYKYMGIGGELDSAFQGTFGDEAVFGFLRQMGWGQIGATRKSQRRRFRRGIYY